MWVFLCHKVILGFCIFNKFLIQISYVQNLLCDRCRTEWEKNPFCSEVLKTNFLHYALLHFYQLTGSSIRHKAKQKFMFAQLQHSCETCRLLLTSECKMYYPWNSCCKTVGTKGGMKTYSCGREGGDVEKNSDVVMIVKHLSQISLKY